MKVKTAKRLYRALAILLGVLVVLGALLFSLQVADIVTEQKAHVTPSYPKTDINSYLEKESWTDEDYSVLYHQTGLGRSALDDIKASAALSVDPVSALKSKILPFQEALFYEGEIEHEIVAVTSKRDMMKNFSAPMAPLKKGDVLVSSSTHSWGWRNGHASLVVHRFGSVLESLEVGLPSSVSGAGSDWFSESSNFMLLRLKNADQDVLDKLVEDALVSLKNVPYSLTVGIFGKKDRGTAPDKTQCAHLVWQAYKNAGFDIDANGGGLVTPRDIARCPLFEVVQVYGFDPDKLW